MYDFVVIPRREELVVGRATALRRFAKALAHGPIGLTPEGLRVPGHSWNRRRGMACFWRLSPALGSRCSPVGLWEEDDTLVVRFGAPFGLDVPHNLTREEQDRAAREAVMVAIGRELPPSYRGVYAEVIAQNTGHGP